VKSDSLEQLRGAFGVWRAGKRHRQEKMPEELLKQALRAARKHGVARVVRVVKVDRRRLAGGRASVRAERESQVRTPTAPSYSRLPLMGPSSSPPPFAELEMPSGVKLRLYSQTQEAIHLLTSMCSVGVSR